MMKNNKKIALTLGTLVSIAIPIGAVVSCGVVQPTVDDAELKIKLKKAETIKAAKDTWQKMIIQEQLTETKGSVTTKPFNKTNEFDYTIKDKTSLLSEFAFDEIREAAQNYVMNKLMKDNNWVRTIGSKITTTKAFREIARQQRKGVNALATSWHLNSYRENGIIEFKDNINKDSLSENALAFMFENNETFKQEVINSLISYNYLSDTTITRDKFEEIFYDKDKQQKLTQIQKIISNDHFLVIDQMIKQKLAFNWNASQSDRIKLAHLTAIYNNQQKDKISGLTVDKNNKLHTYIDSIENADAQMQSPTSVIYSSLSYGDRTKKIIAGQYDSLLNGHKLAIARAKFNGITSLPGGRGVLKFDLKALKEATGYHKWDGFLQNSRLVRKEINFFPEGSIYGPLSMKRYQGIMPIFDGSEFQIPDFGQKLSEVPSGTTPVSLVNYALMKTTAAPAIPHKDAVAEVLAVAHVDAVREVDAVAHVDAVTSAAGVVTTPEVAAVAHVNAVAEVLAVAHVDAVAEVLGFDEVTAKQASANVAKIKSLTWLLANNSQVYFDAKKYYLNRKEDSNHNNKPIKLVVENDYFRNVLIDHGFDFIKED